MMNHQKYYHVQKGFLMLKKLALSLSLITGLNMSALAFSTILIQKNKEQIVCFTLEDGKPFQRDVYFREVSPKNKNPFAFEMTSVNSEQILLTFTENNEKLSMNIGDHLEFGDNNDNIFDIHYQKIQKIVCK